jgi:MFS family permease
VASTIDSPRPAAGAARTVLFTLTLVNLFNYIDRFILPGLAVSLKLSALHITDTQLGLLSTSFILVYALSAPRFGELGDRQRRPQLIAGGVAVWSVATIFGGFAWSFLSLLIARAILGIGEGANGSVAPALLADTFPRERRGRVFAIFFSAIPIGAALGYMLAGVMDKHFGWRSAFFVAGAPSLLLAILLSRLPEATRRELAPPLLKRTRAAIYGGLVRNRQYVLTVLGYAMYTFAMGALAVWMPSFLTRVHGVARDTAAVQVGAIAVVTGLVGTFAGGWLGDWLLRYTKHAYLLLSSVTTLLAVPFVLITLLAHQPHWFMSGLIVAELLMFASTGPVNSAIISYVPATQQATAMALSILTIHLLGDAPSPAIVGWLSDTAHATGMADGDALRRGLMILPAAVAASGVLWAIGAAGKRQLSS